MNIAINGLGRIGKTVLRALLQRYKELPTISPVAINIGPASIEELIYTIKYDSVMGPLKHESISLQDSTLHLGPWKIKILQEREPENLPWKALGIDWVIECSGLFTERQQAEHHLHAGAQKVLISAPAKNPDNTIIPGVNETIYNPKNDRIISLGSCTTNAIAPLIKVLLDTTHIEALHLTTTHAYTNTQTLLDSIPTTTKDVRRFRAAAINIIPGSTGAGTLMGEIFPQLKGKTSAQALRVPVANVSLVELTFQSTMPLHQEQLLSAYIKAAQTNLVGILDITHEPVVSSDFIGSPYSVILDAELLSTTRSMGSIFGWYDNEYGYSNRLLDFLATIH